MAMFFEQKITSVLCRLTAANEIEKLQSFLMFDFWYCSNASDEREVTDS